MWVMWAFALLVGSPSYCQLSPLPGTSLFTGGLMLGADYSQLELRVIAHLSGDRKLISILNNDGDVFKMIAAQWKNTLPEAVTAEERQHAKQVSVHHYPSSSLSWSSSSSSSIHWLACLSGCHDKVIQQSAVLSCSEQGWPSVIPSLPEVERSAFFPAILYMSIALRKGPHRLTFMWWGCYGLCQRDKPTELAHSYLFCSCVYLCLYGPFNCISFHEVSWQLFVFLLCSSSLISAYWSFQPCISSWKSPSALISVVVVAWTQNTN